MIWYYVMQINNIITDNDDYYAMETFRLQGRTWTVSN